MSRRTYVFAGPAESADVLMSVIETALGRPFVREPGSDPYLTIAPVNVYVSDHDFDDDDIESPDGWLVPLASRYPLMVDIRDVERDTAHQEDTAARIVAAVRADGRLRAVSVDDMQHVIGRYDPPG